MASSGSKVSLGCWPISQSIGRDLEQKLNLLYVFNCGKSAILSTVDNDVYSVGLNPSAALGTGASQQCIFNPTKIQDVTGLVDIAAGVAGSNALVIAVTKDGALFGWGYNGHGNLGLGHMNSPVLAPTNIHQNITGIKMSKVACGNYHTLVLSDSGQVFAFGYNGYGQLGNNTTANSASVIRVIGLEKCVCVDAVCGSNSSYAITQEGQVYSWGYNGCGQLAVGSGGSNYSLPQQTKLQAVITSIAAGLNHVLAVDDHGNMYTWGGNDKGQLGNQSTSNSNVPVLFTKNKFVDVAAYAALNISAAMDLTGRVFVWGETALQNYNTPMETEVQSLDDVFCVYGNGAMYRAVHIEKDAASISETVKLQFNNQETADVEFVVKGKSIHAHKMLLILRCDYFKSMFSDGTWKESKERKQVIESFSYEVFYAFIKYLYTDEVNIKPEHEIGLLELSQQYTEWALKKKVEHLIKKGLSTDNVAGLYGVATKFDAKVLEESCVKFAASHMKVVMNSDGFKKLPGDIAHTFVCKLSERDVYKT